MLNANVLWNIKGLGCFAIGRLLVQRSMNETKAKYLFSKAFQDNIMRIDLNSALNALILMMKPSKNLGRVVQRSMVKHAIFCI